jgi:sec-independent protein translocase protein TatA
MTLDFAGNAPRFEVSPVSIGPMEIILVLVIALLVFGPNRLPQAGRNLGRMVREFKRATDTAKTELGLDEVIDEFKSARDAITSEVDGVKSGISDDLKGTGATEAMNAIKTGMSVDLKNPMANLKSPMAMAKSVIGAGAASGAAAVDKPVQVAPAADEDEVWPPDAAVPPQTASADGPPVPAGVDA